MTATTTEPTETPATAVSDEEDLKAYAALAEAFATIERYGSYLPLRLQLSFGDGLLAWLDEPGSWFDDPEMLRKFLPTLIQRSYEAGTAAKG